MGLENLDGMQDEIARLGLDVEWQRSGMLAVATEPHQVEWLQDEAESGQGSFLGRADVQSEVHSPTYLAGLFDADTCAIVHPAKLAFELARACQEAGVRIYEHTNAVSLDSGGAALRVDTGGAIVTARQAVLATNVFTSLLRRNRFHTVPVYDYVLATEPLTDAQLDRIGWQGRQGIGDSANQFHYYRLTQDNRIVWGGYDAIYHFGRRVDASYEDRPATYRRLAEHFFITFPQLADVRFSHRWAGAIDTNTRFCAHWGLARDGRVAYVNGYTGLGVAATRFAADVCLDLLDGSGHPTNRARNGPQAPAAVPARAVGQHRHPGHPVVARSRRSLRGPAQCFAAHAGRLGPRVRLLASRNRLFANRFAGAEPNRPRVACPSVSSHGSMSGRGRHRGRQTPKRREAGGRPEADVQQRCVRGGPAG